jgi:hypothetical protein
MHLGTRKSNYLLGLLIIGAVLISMVVLFSHPALASTYETSQIKAEKEVDEVTLIPDQQGQVITSTWNFESGPEGWEPVDFRGDGPSYWEANPSLGGSLGVWQTIVSSNVEYRYAYIMYPYPVSLDRVTLDYYIRESGFNVGGAAFWIYTSTNKADWTLAATIPQYEPAGGGHYSRSANVIIDHKYVMVGMRINRAFASLGAPHPYGYLDNVIFKNCLGCGPLTLEVLDSNNNLVNNLGNNNEGWPTPNPLTAIVTFSCPAGGPNCTDSFNLTIGSTNNARFYLYAKELGADQDPMIVNCDDVFTGPTPYSHESYMGVCTRAAVPGSTTFTVLAGDTKTLQWQVWIQPSQLADLDFVATWGTNTVTWTVQIPQAQIHPVGLLQGFFGNSESFVSLLFGPLIETLEKMGYQYGHTLFVGEYSYWADTAYAAGQLSDQLVAWQTTARQVEWVNKFPDEQEGFFDLMGLSQGALVARTYVQTGNYPVDIHRLLLIGSPNRGAPYVYRAREGLEADASLWQLMLSQGLKVGALRCGYIHVTDYGKIYFTTGDRYETLHDLSCGLLFMPQILPAPGPNDVAYLFDDSREYPYSRQSNPLLEGPPSDVTDDPWWRPQQGTPPSTSYLNLNSSANIAILGNRINGLGNPYLLYNNGIDEAQGYKVHPRHWDLENPFLPLWRNGRVIDPRSLTGPSDGSVPFYSARAADLWSGSQERNLFVAGDNREERHANLPVYPESQQIIAEILTGFTSPFTTSLNAMNNYVQTGDVKAFFITGMSPIELSITDPSGRQLGYDPATGQIVNEIPLGFYNHPANETADLMIFDPLPGEYSFTILGTGAGNYTILAQFVDSAAAAPIYYETGNAQPGITRTISLTVPNQSSEVAYPPDVAAGPDTEARVGETVIFTGTINDINPGDTFSITWDFDDGGLSTNTLNPTHTFLNQGNYIITLTVTDTAEFVVSDTLRVIVTEPPLYLPIIMKQASGAATLTAPATDNLPFISPIPIPTPTPIPPSLMIDSLITNLDAACQQGQVDNQGVCHNLQGKLMKAQQYFNEDKID